jgi:coenzyme F420-reducing hydrogenase alpha subunit
VNVEGELRVAVRWDGERVHGATVRSDRPDVARALLEGRRVEEVLAAVPLLFSICGRSQRIAAVLACEAAEGQLPDVREQLRRRRLAQLEIVSEVLWRALLDWPRLLGETPMAEPMVQARERLARAQAALEAEGAPGAPAARAGERAGERRDDAQTEALSILASKAVFGMPAAQWLGLAEERGLTQWAQHRATPAARLVERLLALRRDLPPDRGRLMPPADEPLVAGEIAARLDAEDGFAQAPDLDGTPVESTAAARTLAHPLVAASLAHGASVVARVIARLVELAALLGPEAGGARAGSIGAAVAPQGGGVGWVETARGLLVHRVRIADGRARTYRIVAPTEWNFHPTGALVRGLRGLRAASQASLQERVGLVVQSLDPCVGYRLEIGRA